MESYKKTIKAALYLVYVFGAVLAAVSVGLPFIVTWYVETRGRDQTLPVTVMLTCYPCLPFAVAILAALRRFLKNALSGIILGDKNLTCLKAAAISSFAIAAITVAAGRQYKPFYIIAFAAAALGLVFFVVKSLFDALLQKQREKDLGDIKEEL